MQVVDILGALSQLKTAGHWLLPVVRLADATREILRLDAMAAPVLGGLEP
jgi:hypothetical protein